MRIVRFEALRPGAVVSEADQYAAACSPYDLSARQLFEIVCLLMLRARDLSNFRQLRVAFDWQVPEAQCSSQMLANLHNDMTRTSLYTLITGKADQTAGQQEPPRKT